MRVNQTRERLRGVMLSIWKRRGEKQKGEMEEKWIWERHIETDWSQGMPFKYPLWEKSEDEKFHSSGIQASLHLWHRPDNEVVEWGLTSVEKAGRESKQGNALS